MVDGCWRLKGTPRGWIAVRVCSPRPEKPSRVVVLSSLESRGGVRNPRRNAYPRRNPVEFRFTSERSRAVR